MTSLAIIIPLYDKAAWIADAIVSLAAQDRPPDQLIVVDDASTDGGAEVAEAALAAHSGALGSTELVRLPRNCGPGAARNAGIARATTDLVLCLDADDMLRSDALRQIRTRMARHDLALMVLGYASDPPGEIFPHVGAFAHLLAPLEDDLHLLPEPLAIAAHPAFFMGRASNVVVRRDWLYGHAYCTRARLGEGIDLWYRVLKGIAAAGARAGLCAAPLIRFRILPESLSHRPPADWRGFPVPPTVRRYEDSRDPDDRAMARMLAERWLGHALSILPPGEKAPFLAYHRALLADLAIHLFPAEEAA